MEVPAPAMEGPVLAMVAVVVLVLVMPLKNTVLPLPVMVVPAQAMEGPPVPAMPALAMEVTYSQTMVSRQSKWQVQAITIAQAMGVVEVKEVMEALVVEEEVQVISAAMQLT